MTLQNRVSQALAWCLIASTAALGIPVAAEPASAAAGALASVRGTVLSADSGAPLAQARVHASEPRAERFFSSQPCESDGSFRLGDLPAGTYELAVESAGALYLAQAPLRLEPGQSRSVHLAVRKTASQDPSAANQRGGFFENPVTAALTIAGIATATGLLLNEWTNDEDESDRDASPSN
jgi:hypothetical protein